MNRNWLIGLVLAAAALFAGWYFVSPLYALNSLRDAAGSGEEAALEGSVDFPMLRASLKAELRARMAGEIGHVAGGGLGNLGATVAMSMVDPIVEGLVTPQSIATMVRQGDVVRREPASDSAPAATTTSEGEWSIERDGFARFTARSKSSDAEPGAGLIFERRGLGWKLVGIDLPAD